MTTPTLTPAGWYSDPSSRHEYRYWDGGHWTPHVSDRGHTATDPELRPPTDPAAGPTAHPLATPAPALAAPAWPQPATAQSQAPSPAPPIQPEPGPWLGQGQAATSKPTPAPATARAGRRSWAVPLTATVALLAVLAALVVWAPWVSKVPTVPSAVRAQSPTATSVLVQWAPSTAGPTVDRYLILRNKVQVGSVPRATTAYQDQGLVPATAYSYSVVAMSGDVRSAPSPVLVVKTLTPPISDARLQGSWTVDSKVVKSSGGTPKVGETEQNTWQLAPKCTAGPCAVVVSAGFGSHPFTVTLTRAGAVYSGTTKAHISHCGNPPDEKAVVDSVTLRITVNQAAVGNRAWTATSWVGTLGYSSPYTAAGDGYCDPQSIGFTLTAVP